MKRALLLAPVLLLLASGCSTVVTTRAPSSGPPGHARLAHIRIPPGHLPPPGLCRVWIPGRPPGRQPPPGPCSELARQVPPGAWLVTRPGRDRDRIRVSFYDHKRPGVVVDIAIYEAATGKLVGDGGD